MAKDNLSKEAMAEEPALGLLSTEALLAEFIPHLENEGKLGVEARLLTSVLPVVVAALRAEQGRRTVPPEVVIGSIGLIGRIMSIISRMCFLPGKRETGIGYLADCSERFAVVETGMALEYVERGTTTH